MRPGVRQVLFGRKFDYFVDSVRGSDTNSGRTATSAFATLSAVQTAVGSQSGKRIGLAKGSTWLEQFVLSANNSIRIGAYGNGSDPFIDCRAAVAAVAWSAYATGGRTKVYQATITLPNSVKALGNIWQDEAMLTQMATIPTDTDLGKAFVSDWTASSATLYVVLSDGTDPGLGVKVVRYSRRLWAIAITGENCSVKSIKVRGNAHQDGAIALYGQNQLVDSCRLEDGCRHSLYFGAGSVVRGSYFYRARNDLESNAISFVVWNQTTITAGRCYSSGNTFDADSVTSISALLAHDDTLGHLALSGSSDSDTFMNGCGAGFVTTSTTFNNPVLSSAGDFIGPSNNSCAFIINNISGTIAGVGRFINASTGGSVTVTGGSLTVAQVGNGVIFGSSTTADLNVTLNGGFALNLTALGAANFKVVTFPRGALVYNNITIGPALVCPFTTMFEVGTGGQTGTITGNNNTLPYGASWALNTVTSRTLAAWTVASGQDAASVYGARTTVYSDDFTGSNGNLEARTNWSKKSGTAGALQVQTNAVRSQNVGFGTFAMPPLGSADMWAECVLKTTTPPNIVPTLRVQDSSNYFGGSTNGTNYFLQRWVAGAFNQPGNSTGITPATDDVVCVAIRGDLAVLYVNKARAVGPLTMGVSALTGTQAGLTGGSGASDPMLDDFACGTV